MSEEAKEAAEISETKDAAPIGLLALRDTAVSAAALSLWAAADSWYATSGLGLAWLLSVVDGLLVGTLLAAISHEWGHLAGARMSGATAPTKSINSIFPIFEFDFGRSGPEHFKAMSVWGNVAHWSTVILLAMLLPLDAPGRIALVSGAFGFAVFASTTEVPVIRRSQAGLSPAEALAGLSLDNIKRNGWIGAASGLALLAIL